MYRAESICCQASCFLTAFRLYFEEGDDMLFTRVVLVLCNSMSRAYNRYIDSRRIDISTYRQSTYRQWNENCSWAYKQANTII